MNLDGHSTEYGFNHFAAIVPNSSIECQINERGNALFEKGNLLNAWKGK